MLRLLVTLACLTPVAFASWVQIGFLTNESPQSVSLQVESLPEARQFELREAGDAQRSCWLSPPIFFEGRGEQDCIVAWKQAGVAHERRFTLRADSPMQLLLVEETHADLKRAVEQPFDVQLELAPNPFNVMATLSLTLPEAAHADLKVYDVLGRRISDLFDQPLSAGSHRWTIDGSTWASGTYFLSYRLSPGPSGVRRLLLLK